MKIQRKNRSKLAAIGRTVKKGLPLAGLVGTVAAVTAAAGPRPVAGGMVVGKMQAPEEVSIDVMTLYHRRFTTPGIMYPPPLSFVVKPYVVAEGETWETLAKKHNVTLEIMLRINGVPAEKVYAILDGGGKIPPELALKAGQVINVNFPDCAPEECKGIQWNCRVGIDTPYIDYYTVSAELPRGGKRYTIHWIDRDHANEGTDLRALLDSYVAVGIVNNIS